MPEIITWLSGKDELHKLKSLKLTKVILIKVSYITQERNEWTSWHGDTDVVRRYKQNVYLSDDEVKSAVEKLRTPGTYFSIDEAPAFLFIGDDIGYLVTEFYTDNPLHDLHSEEKSWVSCKNILDVDGLIPESRFRFKYLIRGLGQPTRACTNNEVFYHMTSSSGGKKNGLAWALKPRPIDINKYLQDVRIINEAIQGSNVGSIVGDEVSENQPTQTAQLLNAKLPSSQSLNYCLNKVLSEYLQAKEDVFSKHPLANFIRNELTNSVAEASEQSEKYLFKGSAGQGNWARGPWVAAFNPDITSSAQKGYYPVYLFREDMAGVYLSLNQAMTEQKELYKSDAKTALKAKAENFRAMLGPKTGGFNVNEIDLDPSAPSNDTAFYEAGNIVAKYYPGDSIPNDELLKKDLIQVLSLYDDLLYGEAASESESMIDGDEPDNLHYEDAGKLRLHKRIERNPKLAQAAKKILGCVCQVCGLDFEKRYGIIGKDYIEAHHLEPISELKGKKVKRDPASDFAVLCSNCHRMIHKSSFVGDVQSFKKKHFKG